MNEQRRIIDAEYISADDQLDGDTAAEFASFIDDMNSTDNADAWITVMRIPTDARGTPLPNSKHMGQLFNEPLGTSSVNDVLERIRREFIRPGEASITVRIIGKQQGMKGLKFNRIYTIERPNKGETSENGGRESLADIMRIMADNQRATDERIERLLAARATVGPAPDPLAQVAGLLTAMAPLMAAVAGRPVAPPTNGAAEMLATLKVMKEASNMFGGNSGGDDEGSTMKTVRAVAEAVAPGLKFLANRSETERMTVAERLRRLPAPPQIPPPATPKVAQGKPPGTKAPPPVRPNPTPPNKVATPNNNTGTNVPEDEDVNLKDLREKLEIVAVMCDEGQTPEAVAELIVDNCEDDQLEELYRRVEPENAVAQFAILAPAAVRGREEFFKKLRLAILAQYEDDPDATESVADLAADPVDVNSIPDA